MDLATTDTATRNTGPMWVGPEEFTGASSADSTNRATGDRHLRYADLAGGNLGDFCSTPVPNFPERARLLDDYRRVATPILARQRKSKHHSLREAVMGKSKPKHILLVEHYDPVRELIANMLEDRGYRVSTVPAGASMRDFLRTDDRVDAIVINAVTPGENGASLARHAKDLGLPVVMISGSNDEISFAAERGLQLLRKPFQAEELYGALERALSSGEFGQRSA